MRGLLRHLYSDSICMLLKFLLGLPCVPGAQRVAQSPVLPLRTVISGSGLLITAGIRELLDPSSSAQDVTALLCAVCDHLPTQPDARELSAALTRSLAPQLPKLLAVVLHPPAAPRAMAVLQLLTACLQMEQRCEALARELDSFRPPGSEEQAGGSGPDLAARLLPVIPALRERLMGCRTLEQLKLAELLVTYSAFASPAMHARLAPLGLLRSFVDLFLQEDCNGGGRQDALRHVLLRGFHATLASPSAEQIRALVTDTRLLPRLAHALSPEGAPCCSPEHARLFFNALEHAMGQHATVRTALLTSPLEWQALVRAANGEASTCPSPAAPASPARSPDGVAAPATLSMEDQDDIGSEDLEEIPLSEIPLSGAHAEDEENVSPNSPTPTPRRGMPLLGVKEKEIASPTQSSPTQSARGARLPSEAPRPPTPRPASPGATLLMVESGTHRRAEDFSRDTPQPKLVRRSYLPRKAKETSPFGACSPCRSPSNALAASAESQAESQAESDPVELLGNTVRALSF